MVRVRSSLCCVLCECEQTSPNGSVALGASKEGARENEWTGILVWVAKNESLAGRPLHVVSVKVVPLSVLDSLDILQTIQVECHLAECMTANVDVGDLAVPGHGNLWTIEDRRLVHIVPGV